VGAPHSETSAHRAAGVPPLPEEGRRLVEFARAAAHPQGFAWLDDSGRPDPTRPVHTWITARMTYVFALAHQLGVAGASAQAEHGVRALSVELRDADHGGWFESLAPDGSGPEDGTKQAYTHAFVVLAAATAAAADVAGGHDLLDRAVAVVDEHFLDDRGRVVEGWDRSFSTREPYAGANATMHMVEALLVAGDVRGEPHRHRLALGMAEHLIHDVARSRGYLLPEHYTPEWTPLPDYNADRPDDAFRPYGCTPGHLLEWSRLLLQLEASLSAPPSWLLEDARALFDTAVRVGWHVDGRPGFVYTVDWDGAPVVRARMHWVVAEAIGAAAALRRRTGDAAYQRWVEDWWAYARLRLVDAERGSWHHELDPDNRPASTVWQGKPDVYHAFQAVLLPLLPPAPAAAVVLGSAQAAAGG
jgi:sulfoquinovose isomerase